MNLRQLEAFRATIRSGSITEAAKMMHISQPSVSRLIADLELSAGFPLFVRIGRGLTPTVEGRHFYEGVESMFVGIDRLEDLAKSIRTSQGGTISIATIQSIATIELPQAISRLYNDNPDIRFDIQSRNTPAIVDAVQMRQIDLGIVGREPNYDGVDILYQTSAPYVCLMPEDHPAAGEYGAVDLEELAQTETFVTFGDSYPDSMMSIDPALSGKMRARSRLSVANMPLAGALVREASVMAVSDPFSAEQAVRMGGVVFRPIQQNLTYFVTAIAARREKLPREALKFVDLFATQLEERVRQVKSLS
ncbi:LysR family transcriptional regulator [uncultured Sulfitobacter sp.]|uniref:LysR family transcriptional regulator n=1 Tax=uncultured Sulfitobacter sp. TaxID=191468 RepID=UPI0026058DFA|nr:LysR family transcriptional regulator [uncultured Sulfitobacter sp.]